MYAAARMPWGLEFAKTLDFFYMMPQLEGVSLALVTLDIFLYMSALLRLYLPALLGISVYLTDQLFKKGFYVSTEQPSSLHVGIFQNRTAI